MAFFKKKGPAPKDDDDDDREMEMVLFQGATSGLEPNLKENAKLVQVGLMPAKQLVSDALSRRAMMVRLEPKGERVVVQLYVDGYPFPGGVMNRQQANAVVQMLKLLAGLDIKQRQKPQSGGIKAKFQDIPYELQIDSIPVQGGAERLIVRARNLKVRIESPDELGYPQEFKQKIRDLTTNHRGMFLVCGPPLTGVTTTLHGALRSIDSYMYSIYSIADVGTRDLINISQFEIEEGDTLEETLTRVIRAEADVILVDPLRDPEYTKLMFKMSEQVTIITEFPARDAAMGIAQLVKWVGDPKIVAEGLNGIMTTKLVRTLCDKCRQAFRPNPKILQKLGLPPETKTLYRPPPPPGPEDEEAPPCPKCGGIGFFGQAPVLELLEMTEPMKKLVSTNPDPKEIRLLARKAGMRTLATDGMRLVAAGKTSLEELQRVFKPT